jgi:chromate transporter
MATAALWLALWWLPVALLITLTGRNHVLVQEAVFFSKTAVLTFGGAYAVLSYVAQQAVEIYGWLLPGEMLDGLGMAETTPGPLIQVVQFVGFLGAYRTPGVLSPLLAGILGSIVTTWVTFTPCFLWILTAAPYIEYLRGRRVLRAALATITAAVVGVILNLSLWFATHTLFSETRVVTTWGLDMVVPSWPSLDPVSAAIALLSALMIWRGRGMLEVLALAALIGTAWTLAGG